MKQVEAAGGQRLPRIAGVADGLPIAGGAGVRRPATVIWATGHRPDLDWIAGLPLDEYGLPVTRRGVAENMPGLYVVGMPFQYAPTSAGWGGMRGMWWADCGGEVNMSMIRARSCPPVECVATRYPEIDGMLEASMASSCVFRAERAPSR